MIRSLGSRREWVRRVNAWHYYAEGAQLNHQQEANRNVFAEEEGDRGRQSEAEGGRVTEAQERTERRTVWVCAWLVRH